MPASSWEQSILQHGVKKIILAGDTNYQEKTPKDCVFFTHAIIPHLTGTDVLRDYCKAHDLHVWCRIASRPILDLPVSSEFPFQRAVFTTGQKDWIRVMEAIDQISIVADGIYNVGFWKCVAIDEKLGDIAELTKHIYVLGVADPKRCLMPVYDEDIIRFATQPPMPEESAIARKLQSVNLLHFLKDHV